MNKGIYLLGTCLGYQESEWKSASSGKSGMNRRVAIVVDEYEDQWEQKQQQIQLVDISQEVAPLIGARANDLKGKMVQIRVRFTARPGGRDGAFLSCYMPKDADILEISRPAPVKQTS